MRARTLWLFALPLLPAAHHPTPTVVLIQQTDLIRRTLPEATQFFLKTVSIGKEDLARIRREIDFTPDDPDVKFYVGRRADGSPAGAVFFPQVNTVHGPLEVGLTMTPDGAIASAAVTTATVETKPWVEEVIATGLLDRFRGMRYGDSVETALRDPAVERTGSMPRFEARIIATAVHHGLVLYHDLFEP
jgi:hypothetical protein